MNSEDKYPALMAYIRDRSDQDEKMAWNMLRADEAAAVEGGHAGVARTSKTLRQIMRLLRSRRVEAVEPLLNTWAP